VKDLGKESVNKSLTVIDELLPIWFALAASSGLMIGKFTNAFSALIDLALPLFLFLIMVVAMTRLHYYRTQYQKHKFTRDYFLVLFFNFVIHPVLLFFFTKIFFFENKDLGTGFLLTQIFPSITIMMLWVDLARGDRVKSSLYLLINAVGQFLLTPFWIFFFTGNTILFNWKIFSGLLLFYIFIPLLIGFLINHFIVKHWGYQWLAENIIPKMNHWQMQLLITSVFVLYTSRGGLLMELPDLIWKFFLPFFLYYHLVLFLIWAVCVFNKIDYGQAISMIYSVWSRSLTFPMMAAISLFWDRPAIIAMVALAPLIEFPLMLSYSYLFRAIKKYAFFKAFRFHEN
jgi:ACR3 family arsenite transporter